MRIINQRRDISLNFDQISVFLDGETIYTTIDEKTRILGRYESERRAKEVFADIHISIRLVTVYEMPLE